jgi:phage tail protein X
MPNLFVVGTERNLADLADAVLRKRTAAATRTSALDAIRAANPGLDLDRIVAGTVVLLPDVTGVRPAAATEPVRDTTGDLLARVQEGIGALVAAGGTAEEQRRLERQEAEDVFSDKVLKRLSSQVPELVANVKSVRKSLAADDADAEQAQELLRTSADEWAADLETLGGLHR